MYSVTIGKFDKIEKRGISHRYFIDDSSFKNIIGIEHNGKIYDIENGNSYKMIRRNKRGFIDNEQEILLNEDYALYMDEYNNYTVKEYLKASSLKLKLNNIFSKLLLNSNIDEYKKIKIK